LDLVAGCRYNTLSGSANGFQTKNGVCVMPQRTPSPKASAPPVRVHHPEAALLSYLVPGLGQIYQGRVAKGLLFLVCLYGLFFYGMYLGSWKNVYLYFNNEENSFRLALSRGKFSDLIVRMHYFGQFWIGVAAWPALFQHYSYDATQEKGPLFGTFQRLPKEGYPNDPPNQGTLNELQRDGDKTWDLGWIYTVIAGVLNILVIYDAYAGPAFVRQKDEAEPVQEAAAA
jgi:TM2 domain-containing membrane protein YozV